MRDVLGNRDRLQRRSYSLVRECCDRTCGGNMALAAFVACARLASARCAFMRHAQESRWEVTGRMRQALAIGWGAWLGGVEGR